MRGESFNRSPERKLGVGRARRAAWALVWLLGAVAIAAFALFVKHAVIDPAMTAGPDGTFGEMYGPVSYFRVPFYVIAGAAVIGALCGAVWCAASRFRRSSWCGDRPG